MFNWISREFWHPDAKTDTVLEANSGFRILVTFVKKKHTRKWIPATEARACLQNRVSFAIGVSKSIEIQLKINTF